MYADPEVMWFIGGIRPERTPEQVVAGWLERWELNGFGQLVVEDREAGELLGRTGLVVWDTREWRISSLPEAGTYAQPELGWAFARAAWGHGYATEAGLAVREWAHDLGIARLISVIAPDNARSQRVAEKLGCTPGETVHLWDTGSAVIWEHPR